MSPAATATPTVTPQLPGADLPESAEKRAASILDEAEAWAAQLQSIWVRLLKRERAVIIQKVKGSKAREGTKFWDWGDRPPLEYKAFDPKKWIDKSRWLDELGGETKELLTRFFKAYFKRAGMDEKAAAKLAEALTNERVDSALEWHEAYLDRLGELAREAAEREGSTIEDVVNAIEVAFDAAEEHAEAVAVSQAIGSANQAQLEMIKGMGLRGKKVWFSAKDERVRPTHRTAHGQRRDFGSSFKVGEATMQYPGDRSAPVGEWINCRCVLLFYPATESGEPVEALEAASAWRGLQDQLAGEILEWKERRVRTPGGARHYGQPVGSVIVLDRPEEPPLLRGWPRALAHAVDHPAEAPSLRYWLTPDGKWAPVEWHEDVFGPDQRYREFVEETGAARITLAPVELAIDLYSPITSEQIDALSTAVRRPLVFVAASTRTNPEMFEQRLRNNPEPEAIRRVLEDANAYLRGRVRRYPSRLAEFKEVRRVRSPEGARRFDQPVGSVIRPDVRQPRGFGGYGQLLDDEPGPAPPTHRFLATTTAPARTLGLINYGTGRGAVPDFDRAETDFRYNPDPVQRAAMIWQRTYAGNALVRDHAVQILEGKDPPALNTDLPAPQLKEWVADATDKEGYERKDLEADLEHAARFILDQIDTSSPTYTQMYRGMTIFAPLNKVRDQFAEGKQVTIGPSSFSLERQTAVTYATHAGAYQRDQGAYGPSANVMIVVEKGAKAMSLDPNLPQRYRGSKEFISAGTFEVTRLDVEEGPEGGGKWEVPRVRVFMRQVEAL